MQSSYPQSQHSPNNANSTVTNSNINSNGHLKVSSRKLHELVSAINPAERLDPEVESLLLDLADDFIENLSVFSCALARHRRSNVLEPRDVELHLEKNWNIKVPGFNTITAANTAANTVAENNNNNSITQTQSWLNNIKPLRKPIINESHRKRLAAVEQYRNQLIQQAAVAEQEKLNKTAAEASASTTSATTNNAAASTESNTAPTDAASIKKRKRGSTVEDSTK